MEHKITDKLHFGVYLPTPEFTAIEEHSCVCYEDMGLVAVTGPAADKLSQQYAELFAAAPENAQLLKDLHAELFNLIKQPYRIPCDCPPATPIYGERGNVIGSEPSFSCVYCRLTTAVDEMYKAEAK